MMSGMASSASSPAMTKPASRKTFFGMVANSATTARTSAVIELLHGHDPVSAPAQMLPAPALTHDGGRAKPGRWRWRLDARRGAGSGGLRPPGAPDRSPADVRSDRPDGRPDGPVA